MKKRCVVFAIASTVNTEQLDGFGAGVAACSDSSNFMSALTHGSKRINNRHLAHPLRARPRFSLRRRLRYLGQALLGLLRC
jgi:hypothetical protein